MIPDLRSGRCRDVIGRPNVSTAVLAWKKRRRETASVPFRRMPVANAACPTFSNMADAVARGFVKKMVLPSELL